jgi:hypothetical protein
MGGTDDGTRSAEGAAMSRQHARAGRAGTGAAKARLGEAHGMARLTERQAAAMRRAAWAWLERHADAARLPAAFFARQAARLGVAPSTARAAVHGDTWGYLADPPPVPR